MEIWTETQLDFIQMELRLLGEVEGPRDWWTAGTDALSSATVGDFVWAASNPNGMRMEHFFRSGVNCNLISRMEFGFIHDLVQGDGRWWTSGTDIGKEEVWPWATSLAPVGDFLDVWPTRRWSLGIVCIFILIMISWELIIVAQSRLL